MRTSLLALGAILGLSFVGVASAAEQRSDRVVASATYASAACRSLMCKGYVLIGVGY